MPVITVMNMKGGVGKTTVSLHLAALLSRTQQKSVLAIDYDPQFNLSQALLAPSKYFALEKERKTILSVLVDDPTDLDPYELQVSGNHTPPKVAEMAAPIWAAGPHRTQFDLIPSTLDLMYVALGDTDGQAKKMEERFGKFIAEAAKAYDVVIIDCHPAGSLFTKTSLRNSDHVIIPVVEERSAVRGIGLMLKFIAAKKKGTAGPTAHILFNRTSRTKISSQEKLIRANKELSPICLKTTLKKYSAFAEPADGQGFVWLSNKAYSTEAYFNARALAKEITDIMDAA